VYESPLRSDGCSKFPETGATRHAEINPKVVSERIGHSSVAFTMQTYVQRSPDLDRDSAAASTIADLILGPEPPPATGAEPPADDGTEPGRATAA
jgi:hypothetical protein